MMPKIGNNLEGKKVIVEAAHIYTDEKPSLEHAISASIGGALGYYLTTQGIENTSWLFIDNYNPFFQGKPPLLDVKAYLASLIPYGFHPVKVVYEADLKGMAQEVLHDLNIKGQTWIHSKTGKVMLNEANVVLYDPVKDHLKCSLMDACLYMLKQEEADAFVTILPQSYEAQQEGTKKVLIKLGKDITGIIPAYYTLNGSITPSSVENENVFPIK